MELTERYIYAVTHRLPVDMQADVSDELRSIIDASLDKKGSRSKKAVIEVLTDLGNPAVLATRYSGTPQYVVGPQFYPIYLQALKMVLSIGLPIVGVIALIVQVVELPSTVGDFITGTIGIVAAATVQMLFWTTLVFFVIERSGVTEKDLHKNSGWTPDTLPATTAKREIPISEGIADIVWYVFIAALPFIAQPLVGVYVDGTTTPFFAAHVWNVGAPVLVILGTLGVLKSILKLKLGKWTKPLAIFNTIYALAFSVTLVYAATRMTLVNPAFLELLDKHITTSTLEQITKATNWTIGISVIVTIGSYIYDATNSLYRAFQRIDETSR